MSDDRGDTTNTLHAGGDVTGPVYQVGGSYIVNQHRWVALIALGAILALVVALVVTRQDDPTRAAAEQPNSTPPPLTTDPTTTAERTTTEPTTPEPTTTDPTTTTPPTTEPPPTPGYTLVYSNDWRLSRTNIDTTPPERTDGTFWVDYLPGIGTPEPAAKDLYATRSMVAEWPGGQIDDAEDCAEAVRQYGTSRVTLSRGGSYCLLTQQGTIGAITNVRFTPDGPFALLTVWSTAP